MELIKKLRKYPNTFDCLDAALALEQARNLIKRAIDDSGLWRTEAAYWLNTWDKDEEEE